jgi:hypothetical protein
MKKTTRKSKGEAKQVIGTVTTYLGHEKSLGGHGTKMVVTGVLKKKFDARLVPDRDPECDHYYTKDNDELARLGGLDPADSVEVQCWHPGEKRWCFVYCEVENIRDLEAFKDLREREEHAATNHGGGFTQKEKTMKLSDACEKYVESQETKGQSASTLGTIRRTLKLLEGEMGADKEVEKILPVHVDKFFKSEAATMQPGKDGLKPRAEPSVLQIRRIVRMAIAWWHQEGIIERLPLPGSEKGLAEKKSKAKAEEPAMPKKLRKEKATPEAEAPAVQPETQSEKE